jgi:hypothetical protein
MDRRTDTDSVGKRQHLTVPGLELRSLGRSACCPSLYLLRYRGSICRADNARNVDIPSDTFKGNVFARCGMITREQNGTFRSQQTELQADWL